MIEAPFKRGGFSCYSDTPIGKPPGVGYWRGMGNRNQNMTIPRQLSLGEGKGQIKAKAQPKPRPVSPGRPSRELDVELLRELRAKGYGFKRMAITYELSHIGDVLA